MPIRYSKTRTRPPFIKLPLSRRRDEVVHLKSKIKRTAAEFGGMFTSHLMLTEPGRPDIFNQDMQFHFVGEDRFTIWNAYIRTAKMVFWDEVSDMALKQTRALLAPTEDDKTSELEFEPADVASNGKIFSYRLIDRDKPLERLGGLTIREHWKKLEIEIVRREPPAAAVYESFELDPEYVYGIGLRIVVDVDVIDQAAIEAAIKKFKTMGETEWRSATAVPRERLPRVSFNEALVGVG